MGTRVLFLYSGLGVGGAERQLAALVPRVRDRGFEPFVATLRVRGRFYEELDAEGVPTSFVDMRSRWDLRGAIRAYRLWRLRPAVVVTHSVDAQVLGQVIADRAGAAHVTVEQGGVGIPRRRHRALLTRLVAPRADAVVAVSPSQLPDLRGLGYRADAVRVIPNTVPSLRPARSRAEVRAELGLEDDDVVAVLVAGLRPEKRPDLFVDGVSRAHAKDPRLHGLVVGDGELRDAVELQVEQTRGAVRMLGERADVLDLMGAADAVCLASDVEGLPLTVLEAMSVGRPVVATDVGGLRDAVLRGRTGWLVPAGDADGFADALLELAADPGRAREMGEAARRRYVERFAVDAMVESYAQVLTELVRR